MDSKVEYISFERGIPYSEALKIYQQEEAERKKKEEEARKAELAKQEKMGSKRKQAVSTKASPDISTIDKLGNLAQKYLGFSEEELAHRDRRHSLLEQAKATAENPEYQKFRQERIALGQVEKEDTAYYRYGNLYNDADLVKGIRAGRLVKDGNAIFRKYQDKNGKFVTENLPIQLIAENGDYEVPKYRDEDLGIWEWEGLNWKDKVKQSRRKFSLQKQGFNEAEIAKNLERNKLNIELDDELFTKKARNTSIEDIKKGVKLNKMETVHSMNIGADWLAHQIGHAFNKGSIGTAFKKGLGLGLGQKLLSYSTGTYSPNEVWGGTTAQTSRQAGQTVRSLAEAIPATILGGAAGASTGVGAAFGSATVGTAMELPEMINEYQRGNLTKSQVGVMAGTNFVSQYVGTKIGTVFNKVGQQNVIKAALTGKDISKSVINSYLKETGYGIAADLALAPPQAVAVMANVTDPEQRKQVFYANLAMQAAMSIGANSLLNTLGIRGNKRAGNAVLDGIENKKWATSDIASDDIINKFNVTSKKEQAKIKNILDDMYSTQEKIEVTEPIAAEYGDTTPKQDIGPKTLIDMVNESVFKENAAQKQEEIKADIQNETQRDMVVVSEFERQLKEQPDSQVMSINKLLGVDSKDPLVQVDVNKGTELAYKEITGKDIFADTPEKIDELTKFREDILTGQNNDIPEHLTLPDHTSVQDNMVKAANSTDVMNPTKENIANNLIRAQEIKHVLDQVLDTVGQTNQKSAIFNLDENIEIPDKENNLFKAILAATYPGKTLQIGEERVPATLENTHRWLLANTLPNAELYGDAPMTKSEIDSYVDSRLVQTGMNIDYDKLHGAYSIGIGKSIPYDEAAGIKYTTIETAPIKTKIKQSKKNIIEASKQATPEEIAVISKPMKGLNTALKKAEKELDKPIVSPEKLAEVQANVKAEAGKVIAELDAQSKPVSKKKGSSILAKKSKVNRTTAKNIANAVKEVIPKQEAKLVDESYVKNQFNPTKPTKAINPKEFAAKSDRHFEYVPIKDIEKFAEHNREINKKWGKQDNTLDVLTEDIRKNGIRNPINLLMDMTGRGLIIEGNTRLAAAKRVGLEYMPVRMFADRRESLPAEAVRDLEVAKHIQATPWGNRPYNLQDQREYSAKLYGFKNAKTQQEVGQSLPLETINPLTGDITNDVGRVADINKDVNLAAHQYLSGANKFAADNNVNGLTPKEYQDIIEAPITGSEQYKSAINTFKQVQEVTDNPADVYIALDEESKAIVKEMEVLTNDPHEISKAEYERQNSDLAPGAADNTKPDGIDPQYDYGAPEYMEAVKNLTGAVMIAGGWLLDDDEDGEIQPLQAALFGGGLIAVGNMAGLKLYLRKMMGNQAGMAKTIFGTRLYSDPSNPKYNNVKYDILGSKFGKNWENEYNPFTNEKWKSKDEMTETLYKVMQENNFTIGNTIKKNFTNTGAKAQEFNSLSPENKKLVANLAHNKDVYHGLGTINNLLVAKNKGKAYIKPRETAIHFLQKNIEKIKSPVARFKSADVEANTQYAFQEGYHQVLDLENKIKTLPNKLDQALNNEKPIYGRVEYAGDILNESRNPNVQASASNYLDLVDIYRDAVANKAPAVAKQEARKTADAAFKELTNVLSEDLRSPESIAKYLTKIHKMRGDDITIDEALKITNAYYTPMKEKIDLVHQTEWDGYSLAHFGKDIDELKIHQNNLQGRHEEMYKVVQELRKDATSVNRDIRKKTLRIGSLEYLSQLERTTPEMKKSYKAEKEALREQEKGLVKSGKEVTNAVKRHINSPEYQEIKRNLKHVEATLANYKNGKRRGHVDTKLGTDINNSILVTVEEIDEQGKVTSYMTSKAKHGGFSRSVREAKKSTNAFLKERNAQVISGVERQKEGYQAKGGRGLYYNEAIVDATDRFGGKIMDETGKAPKRIKVRISIMDTKGYEPLYTSTVNKMGELLTNILNHHGVQTVDTPGESLGYNKNEYQSQIKYLKNAVNELQNTSRFIDDEIAGRVDVFKHIVDEMEGSFNPDPTVRKAYNIQNEQKINELKGLVEGYTNTVERLEAVVSKATVEEAGNKIIRLLEMLRSPNPFMMKTKNFDFMNLGNGRQLRESSKGYHNKSLGSTQTAISRATNTASSGLYYQEAAQMLSAAHGYGMNDKFTKYLEGIVSGGTDKWKMVNKSRVVRTGEINLPGDRVWKIKDTLNNFAGLRATLMLAANSGSGMRNVLLGQVAHIYQAALDAPNLQEGIGDIVKAALGTNLIQSTKRTVDYLKEGLGKDGLNKAILQAKKIKDTNTRVKEMVFLKAIQGGLVQSNMDLQSHRSGSNLFGKLQDAGMAILSGSEFFMNVGLIDDKVKNMIKKQPYDQEVFGTEDNYISYLANEGYKYSEAVMGRYGQLDLPPALQRIGKEWAGTPLMVLLKPAVGYYAASAKVLSNMFVKGKYIDNPNAYQRYLTPVATGMAALIAATIYAGSISTGALSDVIKLVEHAQDRMNKQKDEPTAMRESADISKAIFDKIAEGTDSKNAQQFIKNVRHGLFTAVSNEMGLGMDLNAESGLGNLYPLLIQDFLQMQKDLAPAQVDNNELNKAAQMTYKWAVPTFMKNIYRTIYGRSTGKYINSYGLPTNLDVHYPIASALTGVPMEARHAISDFYNSENPVATPAQQHDYLSRLMPPTLFNNRGEQGLYGIEWVQPTEDKREERDYGISLLAKDAPNIKKEAIKLYQSESIQNKINAETNKLVAYLESLITITNRDGKRETMTKLEAYVQRNDANSQTEMSSFQNENQKAMNELKRKLGEYHMANIVSKVLSNNKYKSIIVLEERDDKPLNGYEYVRDYYENMMTKKGYMEDE